MSFSDFIEEHLDEIMDEWRTFAQSISSDALAMTHLALEDHAREMLLAIARDMKSSQTEDERFVKSKGKRPELSPTLETAAYTHGVTRHLSGFDIDQVVSEFWALRASVLTLWRKSDAVRSGEAAVEEIARFNEGIDQALTESIQSYSAKVSNSRDMFLAVLGHDVRGPLSAINMAAHLLESRTLAEPVRLQIALRVRRAAGVIGRLTTDLLV
jgi:K+-sensing histidine kinase KdpD